ncbi:MAG TPA: hypothetical protein VGK59_21255 [Ohtaekwangia sp.]
MKKNTGFLLTAVAIGIVVMAFNYRSGNSAYGLTIGTPDVKSITSLAFGPEGILFIGDSKSATVFAVDTKDKTTVDKAAAIDLKGVDQKIASILGTTPDKITIQDMAVNPLSKKIYVAVQYSDGTPVLLTIEGEKIQAVSLKDVAFSSIALNNPPAEDAKDQRGRSLRVSTISDLAYADGNVMVSGLSNQEFSSTFRSMTFPFTNKQDAASLEIYHAAHGQYETASPIKTFTTATINNKKYLIASYTCTPLVLFPLDELKPGTHVKGRTVAEMGSGNQPLDMITMNTNGKSFLIMANSNRPVFRVNFKNIEAFQGSLSTPVEENFATEGVAFVNMPLTNVLQLDKMDDNRMVLLQRKANGSLDLWTTDNAQWLLQ